MGTYPSYLIFSVSRSEYFWWSLNDLIGDPMLRIWHSPFSYPTTNFPTCSPKHISCLASQQYLSTMASGDLALGRCESRSNPSGSWIIGRKRPSKSFAQKDASWLKCKMNPCNLGLNDRNSRTLPFACFVFLCFFHFTTKHFQHFQSRKKTENKRQNVLEVAPHIGPRPFTATYGRHGDMLLNPNERVVGLSPKNADNGFVQYVFSIFPVKLFNFFVRQ